MDVEESNTVTITNNEEETHNFVLLLIDLYRMYKPKLGTLGIKNVKRLWEVISEKMREKGYSVTAAKVENKWRVLERNYKKIIDNNNQTGRARKVFIYQKYFDEIYGKKKNVFPTLLLSNDASITPGIDATNKSKGSVTLEEVRLPVLPSCSGLQVLQNTSLPIVPSVPCTTPSSPPVLSISCSTKDNEQTHKRNSLKRTPYKTRNNILLEMQNNLKSYYDKKLEIENKKLAMKERRLDNETRKITAFEEYVKELRSYRDTQGSRGTLKYPFL